MSSQAIAELALVLADVESAPLRSDIALDPHFIVGVAIHRNNVNSAIIEALRQTYSVLEQLLGPEYFTALGRLFVASHPPRSAVLHEYGGELADFIESFPNLAQLNYLADIARLEWARLCAFHAADAIHIHLTPTDLSSLQHVLTRPLRWHPSVVLLQSPHPLFSLWESQINQVDAPKMEHWRSENVLVWRQGLVLCTEPVDERTCQLLHEVNAGCYLADLFTQQVDEQDALLMSIARLLQWQVLCPIT